MNSEPYTADIGSLSSGNPNHRERLKGFGNLILILLVSGLSVYYTGAFWLESGGSVLVLGAIVAVWELGKLLRSDDLAERLSQWAPEMAHWLDTALVIVLACMFVFGSAAYTVGGVLVEAAGEAEALSAEAIATSSRIPVLEAELVTLNAAINQASDEVTLYTNKSWPLNARKSRVALDEYRAARAAVAAELDDLRGVDAMRSAGAAGVSPRFQAIAGAWESVGLPALSGDAGAQARSIERIWSLVIGLMLEFMSISLLLQRHLRAALKQRLLTLARPRVLEVDGLPGVWTPARPLPETLPAAGQPLPEALPGLGRASSPVGQAAHISLDEAEEIEQAAPEVAPARTRTSLRVLSDLPRARSYTWSDDLEEKFIDHLADFMAQESTGLAKIRQLFHVGGERGESLRHRLVEAGVCVWKDPALKAGGITWAAMRPAVEDVLSSSPAWWARQVG